MSEIKPFIAQQSELPILVSMPHTGVKLTPTVAESLTDKAKRLPDTDWYIKELYSFLNEMGVGWLAAEYSRYVIDLNRPFDDEPLYSTKTTGLFPTILFDESPIYEDSSKVSKQHQQWCKQHIWQPYHHYIQTELDRLRQQFGYAILFDAHSIAAQVPMLFDGTLPDFNFGTNNDLSAPKSMCEAAVAELNNSDYSCVSNARFKGGYITRAYGKPEQQQYAIQLELSQSTYLQEKQNCYQLDQNKVATIQPVLENLLRSLLTWAENYR